MTQSGAGWVRMGGWDIRSVPQGWLFVPEFGLRHDSPGPATNITVKDDTLLAGNKLEPYIQVQKDVLRRSFPQAVFAGPQPSALVVAEEAMLLLIRHEGAAGQRFLQVQTYARVSDWIGIITLTTIEAKFTEVRPAYEQFVRSLVIVPLQDQPLPLPGMPDGEQRSRS